MVTMKKHMVLNFLSQMSVQEIHNILVSPPEEEGMKGERVK